MHHQHPQEKSRMILNGIISLWHLTKGGAPDAHGTGDL